MAYHAVDPLSANTLTASKPIWQVKNTLATGSITPLKPLGIKGLRLHHQAVSS
ncbi:MAG: hypothetical protein IPL54_09695 [Chitinophagaceae bacterium]|nr:hypothetical protein [Chitinophagaceae bacterium]